MRYVLLLGAGFSRNWGGWLASDVFGYLLGCNAIREDSVLKRILLDHKSAFEDALARVQADYLNGKSEEATRRLEELQSAIGEMFAAMDEGFQRRQFEFQNELAYQLRTFMIRFDAIFTLNQDSLLERHYLDDNVALRSARKWNGWQLPGMRRVHDPGRTPFDGSLDQWKPKAPEGFVLERQQQPCFTLHGSMNWISPDGGPVLVMGANKVGTLKGHPILKWYFEQFKAHIQQPVRLMVIGYSFRDPHINEAIMEAVRHQNLELFVIDKLGAEAISLGNLSRGGAIYASSDVEDVLEPALIGVSSRSLGEIFGDDRAEHANVMRFFSS